LRLSSYYRAKWGTSKLKTGLFLYLGHRLVQVREAKYIQLLAQC